MVLFHRPNLPNLPNPSLCTRKFSSGKWCLRNSAFTHLLDLLRSDASIKPAAVLPSLDEWVQSEGMDPDGWSEADLLVEYKAAFGLDNADAIDAAVGQKDPVGERVKALNYLETVLATMPD